MGMSFRLYRFDFKAIPVVLTLIVVAVCLRLGMWQLSRAADKDARFAQIAQYEKMGTLSINELLQFQAEQDPTGVSIRLSGQVVTPAAWLLDNRTWQGQPGYDVVLAIKPVGYDKAALVNMGWVKGDYANRDRLPQIDMPQGEITINAFVKSGILDAYVLSDEPETGDSWPRRVQQIDLEQFARQSQIPLYDFILYAQGENNFGFTPHYQPVVMPAEKHRAYAVQWFLLALAAVVIFLFAARQKPSTPSSKEQHHDRT